MPARRQAFSQIESKYVPNRSRDYIWQDDAACGGVDPEEFVYQQKDDPNYKPMSYLTQWGKKKPAGERDANRMRLEKSALLCADCPVKQQCLDSANPSELFWSVRGGLLPGVLEKRIKQGPASDVKDYFPWECKLHGRTFMGLRYGGRGRVEGKKYPYCTECTK